MRAPKAREDGQRRRGNRKCDDEDQLDQRKGVSRKRVGRVEGGGRVRSLHSREIMRVHFARINEHMQDGGGVQVPPVTYRGMKYH
jgi:hypothetical protein